VKSHASLSVSLKTIDRWYQSGLIEGVKAVGPFRVYRGSIVKLVDERGSSPHK